ncbi:hypothetical protein ACEPPN_000394 [Leptodophora sp. 'Broadleaf-Isolate-01']
MRIKLRNEDLDETETEDGDETETEDGDETENGDETEAGNETEDGEIEDGDETETEDGDETEPGDGDETISQPDGESGHEKYPTGAVDPQLSESGERANIYEQPTLSSMVSRLTVAIEGIVAAHTTMEEAFSVLAAHLRQDDGMTLKRTFSEFHSDSATKPTDLSAQLSKRRANVEGGVLV